jgi:hypothetical protein
MITSAALFNVHNEDPYSVPELWDVHPVDKVGVKKKRREND